MLVLQLLLDLVEAVQLAATCPEVLQFLQAANAAQRGEGIILNIQNDKVGDA